MFMLIILSFLLMSLYGTLLWMYRKAWAAIPFFEKPLKSLAETTISIIVPARNEAHNIGACLEAIVHQKYPASLFDVWVVDDHSTDDTAAIVQSYRSKYPNINLISLADITGGKTINAYKKLAIETAIEKSSATLIVTTDADCIALPTWLETLAAFYEEEKPVAIAMPVSIMPESSKASAMAKFLGLFQSLDVLTLQGITGASIQKNFHSMANGANLAYTRKAFKEVDGFNGIDQLASGDDMMLMYKFFKEFPGKIKYLKSTNVIVQTKPESTIGQFMNQRIRWASKSGHYDDKKILPVLLLVYGTNVSVMALFMAACISCDTFIFHQLPVSVFGFAAGLLMFKIAVEWVFLYPVARFFQKTVEMVWFPFMQPCHIIYTIVAGWLGKFGRYRWKGRAVR